MDPHTLMESITSMSEYFVAANTRTSFTDLAESGSLNSLASVGGGLSIASNHNSSSSPSSFNHHHQQQQQQQQQPQQQQQQQQQQQHQSSIVNQQFSSNNNNVGTSNSVHKSNIGNNNHLQQQHVNNNSNIHSPLHQNNYQNNSGHYSSNTSSNNNNSSNNNIGMQLSSCRASQPIRTQIPIHCYIEQLDACADISDYNSSMNDSDLFNTSNSNLNIINSTSNNKPLNHHQQQQQNHQNHQPHLHQSKLALESVTNCTTNTNGTRNNSSLSALANSTSSLFNENDTNNNDNNDLHNVDNPLDQLSSDSPLSINHQTNLSPSNSSVLSGRNHQINNICGNNNIIDRHHQASSSYDNNHFQSCRETYAIVTSNVLYIDLVRTVLLQLGYSAMDLINAKGKYPPLFYFTFLHFYLDSAMMVGCIVADTLQNPSLVRRELEKTKILQLARCLHFVMRISVALILYLFLLHSLLIDSFLS